ncbi:MAG: ribonuclease HII [Candidatus Taylorbacteria bacterium]
MVSKYIIGIDEVGRGPIAGPLTFCALKAPASEKFFQFRGSKDSKKLSPLRREEWFKKIMRERKNGALDFSISHIAPNVLDTIGLSKAIKVAVKRCLDKLEVNPCECEVLLDGGLKAPKEFTNQKTIVRGDEKIKIIGLASIVAKVSRDRIMVRLSKKYENYAFESHKGYGTKEHYKLLRKWGLSKIHRRSFLKNV